MLAFVTGLLLERIAVLSSDPAERERPARPRGPRRVRAEEEDSIKGKTGSARPFRIAAGALATITAAVLIPMAWRKLEASFIYFPARAEDASPEDYGLRAESLAVESAGGVRLEGWWIHGDGQRALLFFHGNAGNVSHRLDRVKLLVEAFGLDVFLVDYRGYGRSGGSPSEEGLYADGEAIAGAAAARGFPPGRTALFGESLGAAVAIETARRRPVGAVILETPFLSIAAMARRYYPFVPAFLLRTRFDNEAKIGHLAVPKLIVAAERDEVVPPDHSKKLFDLAGPPKRFFVVRGAAHNDTYVIGGQEYLGVWGEFLESSLPALPR
jgi:fermentation-respiration switch protein FrsA (DUF1100 family)